ncbi:MAG: hypothetical protein AMDU3_IPLC00003G0017 [Thermoplasmatales archaeon I-plasma]|nr:MAG: hypothetical protein AMDU3_IPLC00003G0017 [Thermoplasmatales archaeon I-plasma]
MADITEPPESEISGWTFHDYDGTLKCISCHIGVDLEPVDCSEPRHLKFYSSRNVPVAPSGVHIETEVVMYTQKDAGVKETPPPAEEGNHGPHGGSNGQPRPGDAPSSPAPPSPELLTFFEWAESTLSSVQNVTRFLEATCYDSFVIVRELGDPYFIRVDTGWYVFANAWQDFLTDNANFPYPSSLRKLSDVDPRCKYRSIKIYPELRTEKKKWALFIPSTPSSPGTADASSLVENPVKKDVCPALEGTVDEVDMDVLMARTGAIPKKSREKPPVEALRGQPVQSGTGQFPSITKETFKNFQSSFMDFVETLTGDDRSIVEDFIHEMQSAWRRKNPAVNLRYVTGALSLREFAEHVEGYVRYLRGPRSRFAVAILKILMNENDAIPFAIDTLHEEGILPSEEVAVSVLKHMMAASDGMNRILVDMVIDLHKFGYVKKKDIVSLMQAWNGEFPDDPLVPFTTDYTAPILQEPAQIEQPKPSDEPSEVHEDLSVEIASPIEIKISPEDLEKAHMIKKNYLENPEVDCVHAKKFIGKFLKLSQENIDHKSRVNAW